MDVDRRFGGVRRLYGDRAFAGFGAARVCVVGVGGVGSWIVEALARNAVGHLTLIDMDHVAESNMNRQLTALEPELGRAKVAVLADRIALINPVCRIDRIGDFVTLENLDRILASTHDWVVDCIDDSRVKAAMIACCRRRAQPILTVGGAGGQVDPARIRVGDLRRTEQDPLLARTRRLLRREYGFPANPRRRFGVPCVWSDEPQAAPAVAGDAPGYGSLNCAGYGSSMAVTASYGLVAAAYVLNRLAATAAHVEAGPP